MLALSPVDVLVRRDVDKVEVDVGVEDVGNVEAPADEATGPAEDVVIPADIVAEEPELSVTVL